LHREFFKNSVGDCQLADHLIAAPDLALEFGNLSVTAADSVPRAARQGRLAGRQEGITPAVQGRF